MSTFLQRARVARKRQSVFPFLVQSRNRERWFKRTISLVTLVTLAGLLAGVPKGRYVVASLVEKSRQLALRAIGVPRERSEIDREWTRYRQQKIEETMKEFRRVWGDTDPSIRHLMEFAGNDPETGLLRWGNFDQTLLFPSTILLPDDSGRSYRFRPNTRAVWLRNLTLKGLPLTFFLVPDTPNLKQAMQGTSAIIVENSLQTTNSWGLRGPEPDLAAPLRGLILGDSYMQGLFIDDNHTPSECLRRHLERRFKTGVSLLNTGHLGYSPEQEYYTLLEYGERFRPQFVIMSLFANDFGSISEVAAGGGDFEEGKYWLREIMTYCRARGIIFLFVPIPMESQIFSRRFAGNYPGQISNSLECNGLQYTDPIEYFVDAHIRRMIDGEKAHNRPTTSPLFNGHIGDTHFSPAGSEVWAAAVGQRIELLIEKGQLEKILKP
jgi:hypothetical protein